MGREGQYRKEEQDRAFSGAAASLNGKFMSSLGILGFLNNKFCLFFIKVGFSNFGFSSGCIAYKLTELMRFCSPLHLLFRVQSEIQVSNRI